MRVSADRGVGWGPAAELHICWKLLGSKRRRIGYRIVDLWKNVSLKLLLMWYYYADFHRSSIFFFSQIDDQDVSGSVVFWEMKLRKLRGESTIIKLKFCVSRLFICFFFTSSSIHLYRTLVKSQSAKKKKGASKKSRSNNLHSPISKLLQNILHVEQVQDRALMKQTMRKNCLSGGRNLERIQAPA